MNWAESTAPPPLPADEVHIWRVALNTSPEQLHACQALLTHPERERMDRLAFDEPRRRFARARGSLRFLLGGYLDMAPADVAIAYGDHGKPALALPDTDLTFNLSHSGDRILLVFARSHAVGVDVERRRRVVDWQAVAGRFFEAQEQQDLADLPEPEQRQAFFRCWTRKEAFLKATGRGVSFGLGNVRVSLRPDEEPCVRWAVDGSTDRWRLVDADPDDDHAGAVCVGAGARQMRFLQNPQL